MFKGGLRMIWSLFMFVRVGIILLGLSFSANACFWLDFGVGMGVLKDVFPNSV